MKGKQERNGARRGRGLKVKAKVGGELAPDFDFKFGG